MKHMNAEDLKRLAAHTKQKLPTRKAEVAAVIMRHLEGEGLKTAWQRLDKVQQAAVAEVVHAGSNRFPGDLFNAKYGCDPNWGTSGRSRYDRCPSALCFFFYGGVMPDDLKARLKAFVPRPAAAKVKALATLPDDCEVPCSWWV